MSKTTKILLGVAVAGVAVAGVAAYELVPQVKFYVRSVVAYLFPASAPADAPRAVPVASVFRGGVSHF